MTIQERLRRSNLVMLVVPVVIAGVLFAAGLGALALLLNAVYLPRLGLTFQDLHSMGEEMEQVFRGLKLFVVLYAAVVLAALLAAVAFTNLYLTCALFAHIQKPLNILLQGVQRIQNGDLETPICYQEADEFRPACDAVDAMAVQLRDSLQQQREQQKKQELIAGMSHDLKSPLTTIRAYTEALLEGVAPDEAARQRYLQTIYTRETDLEALVNRLCALGLGVLMGIAVSIHAIRAALQRSRSAMVWLILGLMLGSLYAIVNGPASLDTPLPALRLATFQLPAFLLGATLLLALEGMKKAMEKTAGKH